MGTVRPPTLPPQGSGLVSCRRQLIWTQVVASEQLSCGSLPSPQAESMHPRQKASPSSDPVGLTLTPLTALLPLPSLERPDFRILLFLASIPLLVLDIPSIFVHLSSDYLSFQTRLAQASPLSANLSSTTLKRDMLRILLVASDRKTQNWMKQ